MVLHVRSWGSGGRTALLLHGMGSSGNTWHAVGPTLAADGYHVVAVDLPGHGHSPRDPQATVDACVTALLQTVQPRPALAVGHSLGGLILAAAAERLRPQRIVYVDIPLGPGPTRPPDRPTLAAEFAADQAASSIDKLRDVRPWWSETDLAIEAEAAAQWDVPTAAALWESVCRHDFTPAGHSDPVNTPSVMVHADPSENVSPEHLANLANRGFTLRGVPGADHTIWYGHLDEFLSSIDDEPAARQEIQPSEHPSP